LTEGVILTQLSSNAGISVLLNRVGCNKLPFHEQFVRTVLEVNKCDCFGKKRNVLLTSVWDLWIWMCVHIFVCTCMVTHSTFIYLTLWKTFAFADKL